MLRELSAVFPEFLPTSDAKLQSNLKAAGFTASASSFVSMAVFLSMSSLLFTFVFLSFFDLSIYLSIPIAAGVFLFLLHLPLLEAKKTEAAIDSVLPLVVFLFYSDVKSGIAREKALKSINLPQLAFLSVQIHSLFKRGLPIELLHLFLSTPSKHCKEFIRLASKHSEVELKKMYKNLIEENANKLKTQSAKASLANMAFITIAAVIPSLFAGLTLLGKVLGFSFTPLQVFFSFTLLFPLLDFAVLYYLELTTG